MPRTVDPYTLLEWTTNNTSASSEREQAMKAGCWKESSGAGYKYLLLCQCIILSSFVIEAATTLKHVIIN